LHLDTVSIEVRTPKFSFTTKRNQISRYVSGEETFSVFHGLDDKTYQVNLPLPEIVGANIEDIYGFFLYHFIEILNVETVNINDYSFKFTITTKDQHDQVITSREFEGIYYLKSSYSSDYDRKYHQEE